eukprot:scaffold1558_cov356-Pavlova_lutheri.AAC.4
MAVVLQWGIISLTSWVALVVRTRKPGSRRTLVGLVHRRRPLPYATSRHKRTGVPYGAGTVQESKM